MLRWLGERGIRRLLLAGVVFDVVYWSLWFGHRPWVASEHTSGYTQFEDAFPLADGWLGAAYLLAWEALWHKRSIALLWLLSAGGAGLYVFGMDVLYDLEHAIYARGGAGITEAVINVLTIAMSVVLLRWTWERQERLSAGDFEQHLADVRAGGE